jgi:hypothetical protein
MMELTLFSSYFEMRVPFISRASNNLLRIAPVFTFRSPLPVEPASPFLAQRVALYQIPSYLDQVFVA